MYTGYGSIDGSQVERVYVPQISRMPVVAELEIGR
jgi:hypothetical protein